MRRKEVLKNAFYEVLNQLIIIIRGFFIPRLIISAYGSSINGLVSSITSFLAYISLLDAGLSVVVKSQLYKPIVNKRRQEIESILCSTSNFFKKIAKVFIIYIILLLLVYPHIITDFNWTFVDLLIIVISLSTFCEYYFGITCRIFLLANGKAYLVSIINMFISIINTILTVILIKYNSDIVLIKLVGSLIFIIKPILSNIYVRKKYKINIKSNCKEYKIKDRWDGLTHHIAWVIYSNTDIVVLTLFSTLSNVSIYSVYSLVCLGLRSIVGAMTSGIDATFGNIIAKGKDKLLSIEFNSYEIVYFSIITIVFSCAIILIIPFVKVYTAGINDANYVNSVFGIIIVLVEYIIALRRPYRALIHAKGHFKQTRNGAIIECVLNIIISVILVFKLGIIGVAIGSFVAALIRTIEFIYHANKVVLNRKVIISFKKIVLVIVSTILIILIAKYIPYVENTGYINFIINSIITFIIAMGVVFITSVIMYRKEILKHFKKDKLKVGVV